MKSTCYYLMKFREKRSPIQAAGSDRDYWVTKKFKYELDEMFELRSDYFMLKNDQKHFKNIKVVKITEEKINL